MGAIPVRIHCGYNNIMLANKRGIPCYIAVTNPSAKHARKGAVRWTNKWLSFGLLMLMGPVFASPPGMPEIEGQPLIESADVVFEQAELPAPSGVDRLRVAYYNIEMFTDGINDGQRRTPELAARQARGAAAIIDELNPDILLLSEIENGSVVSMLNDAMANPFPAGYVVRFGTGGRRSEKMNSAMLSRYRPESVAEIDFGPLRGDGRPTRGLFRAVFDLGDQHYLLVYSAHLKSNFGSRKKNQAQRYHAMRLMREDLHALMAAHPERRWEKLLLADFNSDPLSPQFTGDPTWQVFDDWHDLWSEHPEVAELYTIPTRHGDPRLEFPPALFDRILANPAMREAPWTVSRPDLIARGVETANVHVKPGEENHVSDHFPVYVDLFRSPPED